MWSLPQYFFLTNKVKEIFYKIIHRFYRVQFLYRDLEDTFCSFCEAASETLNHLSMEGSLTHSFWRKTFCDFSLYYRHIIFLFFTNDKNVITVKLDFVYITFFF